jgi:hypothetical protein
MGAITVGVLGAEVSGPPLVGLLLRVFFGLVVGSIAVWMAAIASQALRPSAPSASLALAKIPRLLEELCPACGKISLAGRRCPACAFPLGGGAEGWRAEARSWLGNLMMLSLGAGLVCLGVVLAVGPFLDGERRIWASVAFVALALLVSGVGVLMLWGGGAVALEDLRGVERWVFRSEVEAGDALYQASATALVVKRSLAHARGSSAVKLSAAAVAGLGHAPALVPGQRAFARALSFLYQRGHVAIWAERETAWELGAPRDAATFMQRPPEPQATTVKRTTSQRLLMRVAPRFLDEAARPILEILPVRGYGTTPLAAVWKTWRDSGDDLLRLDEAMARTGRLEDHVVEAAIAAEIGGDLRN